PDKDSLLSREVVPEPHAFEISIVAQTDNEPFMFVLNQEEGKVELSDAQIKAASISIDTAGAARIKSALQLPGEIRL
ncbi:efflux transporter periplasmic adaptor subunit, partial [Mycobacterium tuberculosis]|nr:efflux transporter periplasmic adaptor subunit [Mycobacterium tuberculosis]